MNIPAKKQPFIDGLTDREVVQAILAKDEDVTIAYLYVKCFPLFNYTFKKYNVDYNDCLEFIQDIYVHLMTPAIKKDMPRIASFNYECPLICWLKTVSEHYCSDCRKKRDMYMKGVNVGKAMFEEVESTLKQELSDDVNTIDWEAMIHKIPNERYRKMIYYKYICGLSSQEIASRLNMNIGNYYCKMSLAKAVLIEVLKKEGLL